MLHWIETSQFFFIIKLLFDEKNEFGWGMGLGDSIYLTFWVRRHLFSYRKLIYWIWRIQLVYYEEIKFKNKNKKKLVGKSTKNMRSITKYQYGYRYFSNNLLIKKVICFIRKEVIVDFSLKFSFFQLFFFI